MKEKDLPTTTRGSQIQVSIPDPNACVACVEVASEPESADYLVEQFPKKMKALGKEAVEASQSMQKKFEDHRDKIYMLSEGEELQWSAISPQSRYQNYQQKVADKASENIIAANLGLVNFDVALSNNSEIRKRTYTNKKLEEEAVEFEKLLSVYLAQHNYYIGEETDAAYIYLNNEGYVRVDKSGNPIKADPNALRKLIPDPNIGFQKFLEQQGLKTKVGLYTISEEQPEAAPEAVVEAAKVEAAPEVVPEAPPSAEAEIPSEEEPGQIKPST